MRFSRLWLAVAPMLALAFAGPASAQPVDLLHNVVIVYCDDRRGSGVLTNSAEGFILTVGHVAMDGPGGTPAAECTVGFSHGHDLAPSTYYQATVEHAIFDARTDRDFAVLKLGPKLSGPGTIPKTPIKTNEFAAVGQTITVHGYPGGANGSLQTGMGKITAFRRGTVDTDAPITLGYSGGPALDEQYNLVGLAKRVSIEVDPKTGRETPIAYQLGDVLPLITWLDDFGVGYHDRILSHADPARFDGAAFFIRNEGPGCAHVVRTVATTTLYCLMDGPERLVFPNQATFFSWYPDFTGVKYISTEDIAQYRLIGNVTIKAGWMVKIQTDPKVYLVVDSIGTIRWIQSEERARELFGLDWAANIRDVPDTFFIDYRVRMPLP